ncbi:MAG: hypothetical protein ACKVWV_04700 [Planctomycetota bacterium]
MKSVIAFFALCTALPASAFAQAPTTTGHVQFLATPPPAVYRNAFESDTRIVLFRERGSFVLTADLVVDVLATGVVDQNTDLTPGLLPGGTLVESYLFHQDGKTASELDRSGSATFSKPIIGVIVRQDNPDHRTLSASDPILGHPGTIYPGEMGDTLDNPHRGRGLEFGNLDRIAVSPDRLTLTLTLRTGTYMDHVRVITAADVPAQGFCFGDQSSGQSCPCLAGGAPNDVPSGIRTGCANSTGLGGLLSYSDGSNSTAASLELKMSNLPPNTFGLLYMGQNAVQESFADGFRCVSPGPPGSPPGIGFLRFPIKPANAQGEIKQANIVGHHVSSNGSALIQSGSTWHFQGYYRNPSFGCTNANLTNGLSVTFY